MISAKKALFLCAKRDNMPNTKITTGQYVRIEQPMASVGERILAVIIDMLALFFYSWLALTICLAFLGAFDANDSTIYVVLTLFIFIPCWLYQPLFEAFNKGRTFGKLAMGIKVATDDGSAPSVGMIIIRWLLLTIDIITGIGVVSILFTRKNKRLGDLAAGTIVIKVKKGNAEERIDMLREYGFVNEGYRPFYRSLSRLTPRQAQTISQVLAFYGPNRQYYINRLGDKVIHTLRILPAPGASAQQFLYAVLNDYYYYSSTVEM